MLIKKGKYHEVYEYNGIGYERTMNFEGWRVAILNHEERFDKITKLERHALTDEVFVLLKGTATLILGEELIKEELEPYKIYNVKKDVWHALKVSLDAKVLIVENHNTSLDNTFYLEIPTIE